MSEPEAVNFSTLLAERPPGLFYLIQDAFAPKKESGGMWAHLNLPTLKLYCSHDDCGSHTNWDCHTGEINAGLWDSSNRDRKKIFVNFLCRHCLTSWKEYALLYMRGDQPALGVIAKMGEIPDYGPHIPEKLKKLAGSAREYFFKGRKAENLGLGVAAFAYFRRVVDSQKDAILDEIIKVAEVVGSPASLIADLRRAKGEAQFAKAIKEINPAVPESLFIGGHNPLTLLYSALSEGLHNDDDAECLGLASSIRVVLSELTERVSSAISEKKELTEAVTRLVQKREAKTKAITSTTSEDAIIQPTSNPLS